jgi:hypothetical protein
MNARIIYFAQSTRLAGVISILLLALTLSGCGKKSFPKAEPTEQEGVPHTQDLRAEVRSTGVELAWSIPNQMKPGGSGSEYFFSVLRSELSWANRSCEDCPTPIRSEVLRIDPAYPSPASIQEGRMIWTDTNVAVHHAYRYQIVVKDRKGRTISQSNLSIAKVIPPPGALTDLSAVPGTQGIMLQWKTVTKDELGQKLEGETEYLVERSAPNGRWQKLMQALVKGNTYLDAALTPDQVYNYRVTPELLFEGSPIVGEPAMIQNIKAPDALPPPPPNSVWIIPVKGALEVHWTPSEGKVGGYHVYRRQDKEITRLTASPVQSPPYLDKAVERNQTYYYAVSAVTPQPDQHEGLLSKWTEIRTVLFEQ